MKKICKTLIFTFLLGCNFSFAQTNDKDIAATADRYYKAGNYTEALPLFAQLLSNHASDTRYAYYYGVCRYMRGVNVSDAISYLEKAAANPSTPSDVNYYLARCYHLTYHFSEAASYYEKFKKTAGPQQLQSLEIDLNIQMCRNAINLPDRSDRYLINDKKIVDENQFLVLYQLDPLRDGRILTMTDDYKSSADKKRGEKQYLFLDPTSSKLYYSSRGIESEQSSDIMQSLKKISKWDKAFKLKEANSKYDEINPTASKDGKIIYFSAKSPQSMGGYDIFKIVLNAETGTYSSPENVGAPVNSPYDDFLYASSNIERTNYVTSTRDCEKGKVCVIKFDENEPTDGYINIKGKFFNFDRPNEFNVNIIFYDQQNWKNLGEARVDTKTGDYNIRVPRAARYGCKIDVVGYSLLLGDFTLRYDKRNVNQEIIINKMNNGQERLAINNTYPEDANLVFAQTNPKEAPSKTGAKKQQAGKATTVAKAPAIPSENDLQLKRTVNWKEEEAAIAQSLKPKEDKEIMEWTKQKKESKNTVVTGKQNEKKEAAPAFNLESLTFAELEKQTPQKNTEAQTRQTGPVVKTTAGEPVITLAPKKDIPLITTSQTELAINDNAKRSGKTNYISDLPPIGYEILEDNDKAKKEIIVSGTLTQPVANAADPKQEPAKKRAPLKVQKSELLPQSTLPLPQPELALTNYHQNQGRVNFTRSLPPDNEIIKTAPVALVERKETAQIAASNPVGELKNTSRTGKVNYTTSLPVEKPATEENTIASANVKPGEKVTKTGPVALADKKEITAIAGNNPVTELKKTSKTGKADYISSLPDDKPFAEETIAASVKRTEKLNTVPSKETQSLAWSSPELKAADPKNKSGNVSYIKALPAQTAEAENSEGTAETKTVTDKQPVVVNTVRGKQTRELAVSTPPLKLSERNNTVGNVSYAKSLPPQVDEAEEQNKQVASRANTPATRLQNAIATIEPKEIIALNNNAAKQSLAPMSKAGRVKAKLPIEIAEEKQAIAGAAPAPEAEKVKAARTEIAVVELSTPVQKENDVASLRYRFRAFENKSDSQVRDIVTKATGSGLGQ